VGVGNIALLMTQLKARRATRSVLIKPNLTVFRIRLILIKSNFFSLYFFMFIKQKIVISLKIDYIRIILDDFYVSLSQFFLLPRSKSLFPEVDPDPKHWDSN